MYSFAVSPNLQQNNLVCPQQNATVNRISSGDNDARFRRVVLPHLDDAYSLARWLTGDRGDAEDVVQEACLRAFRGIGGFAGINARAWFLTIVRHAAYTWLGKNRSSALVMVDDPDAVGRPRRRAAGWTRDAGGRADRQDRRGAARTCHRGAAAAVPRDAGAA
jgi:DNA-directed RNA polymerase specialized sigma24 family protein